MTKADEYQKLFDEYQAKFDDIFPTSHFFGITMDEAISMMRTALEKDEPVVFPNDPNTLY